MPVYRGQKHYSLQTMTQEIATYSSRSELLRKAPLLLRRAVHHDLLPDGDEWKAKTYQTYTKESLITEIERAEHDSYESFRKSKIYAPARYYGLLEMARNKWKVKDTHRVHCVYCYIFEDGSVYFGLTVDLETRDIGHKAHSKSAVRRYAEKMGLAIPTPKMLKTELTCWEAEDLEDRLTKEAREEGKRVLTVRARGLGAFGRRKPPTESQVRAKAEEYIGLGLDDFRSQARRYYEAAKALGILDDLGLGYYRRLSREYCEKRLQEVGGKLGDLQKLDRSTYNSLLRYRKEDPSYVDGRSIRFVNQPKLSEEELRKQVTEYSGKGITWLRIHQGSLYRRAKELGILYKIGVNRKAESRSTEVQDPFSHFDDSVSGS